MPQQIPLSYLSPGTRATVSQITADDNIRRRLQDLGFIKGAAVECVFKSPLDEPVAYYVKGALIALRCEDSSKILVE
ncbi:MAG: ferrous iron transport protein A [Clostridia bacterium]|nr:ferrous iron transport protein A [Clostridia bacterium]